MRPITVSSCLEQEGFWHTYWVLRNDFNTTRRNALWLMWVGWNYYHHCAKYRM